MNKQKFVISLFALEILTTFILIISAVICSKKNSCSECMIDSLFSTAVGIGITTLLSMISLLCILSETRIR